MSRAVSIDSLPLSLRVEDAVEAACAADITFIDEHLRRGLSVLVECDKELSLYLYLAVRQRLRRGQSPPRIVLVDGRPAPDAPARPSISRMIEQLGDAIRGSVERAVIVLPHLDVLTTTHTGLTLEARECIPLLYENPEAVVLGFRDPSFEVPKVIRDVFAARREIAGIPRDALAKIITQREAKSLHASHFDPFGLYRYASGMNPVRARRLFADLALRREAGAGEDRSGEVYAELRRQTVSDGVELPEVSLDRDVGGYGEVKQRLRDELLDLVRRKDSLTAPDEIRALESLLPRGVIFHGPPGTGKTYLAKALASSLDATVMVVSGPELKSKWVGESEENLRRVFRQARQAAPSVVIFDEIDAFAHQRGSYQGSGVEHSMVNQLLTEMDGFRKNEMVFVVGTTNYVSSLDGALLRPGRFEFLIEIPAPDAEDRRAITRIYSERLGLGLSQAVVEHITRRTEGMADPSNGLPFTGDHLQALCRALKRQQLREGSTGFSLEDIDRALQRRSQRRIVLSPEEEKVIAVHEAGHALVAMLLPRATPPERISIVQDQDGALGYVQRAAKTRPYVTTEDELRADICVGLGGQVAERLVFREVSAGAASDLQRANALAHAMVERYGMSRGMGPRVVLDDEREGLASPSRRDRIDGEVEAILREEHTRCEALLRKNVSLLEALWTLLLEKKALDAGELRALVPGG